MQLTSKGKQYREAILDQMIKHFGPELTESIMEHDGFLGLVNASAHQASEAKTAEQAAAYPTFLLKRILDAVSSQLKERR